MHPGLVYDAVSLLHFGEPSANVLPAANPGEIVLRYGGWSLRELRDKCELMHRQDWYDRYRWASENLPSGIYVLRLPIPDSNRKSFDRQKALLLPEEEPASVVLAASALLSVRLAGGQDPLRGDWTRCKEQADVGYRVGLDWYGGCLRVSDYWDGNRYDFLWLAAAQRTS